jgi:hypothetical protein
MTTTWGMIAEAIALYTLVQVCPVMAVFGYRKQMMGSDRRIGGI